MICRRLDFDEFVRIVKDGDLDGICDQVTGELRKARSIARSKPAKSPLEQNRLSNYINLLLALRFLLQTGKRPSSVQASELIKMRPVIESLVARKQLTSQELLVFD